MFDIDCLSVNVKGHLTVGGCDAVELSERYGTPLYVMDEMMIRNSCNEYKSLMKEFFGINSRVIYASKAFNCKEICRIMNNEEMYIDVVSEGELYTSLKAGFPADRIYFHGNNKTYDELSMAVKENVGTIVIDSIKEAEEIQSLCYKTGKKIDVLIRVKPGVEAHTHSFIKTGHIDSKFGFAIQNNEAYEVISKIKKFSCLNLRGLHCHIGSQIVESEPFIHTAGIMMDFIFNLTNKLNLEIKELNIGGGFGIKYFPHEIEINKNDCLMKISKIIKEKSVKYNIKEPFISIEPGRSIVGQAGVTFYKVGNIKKIKGVRTYISVDGGMTDNPRYILYGSNYNVLNAGKINLKCDNEVTIAGKCCESGDIIQNNVKICNTNIGDIIAVLCTGAYNYSMASNYNRIPKPAVVMVKRGESRLIVKRQSLEDVIAQDL